MQKKYWIIPGIITATLVASLIALSNPKSGSTESKPTCCKKVIKQCPEKSAEGQSSLDNLSTQFISFPLY